MSISKAWVRLIVIGLLAAQTILIVCALHRESLTFDEPDHMYAGYRMWTAADYGLNPEHPPLVKLLATLPVLQEKLWSPPLVGAFFKGDAILGGRQWLAHNDGGGQRLVFRMRLAAASLALILSLLIFFAAREWFGVPAALIAMTLVVFEPNFLAHSGLVTTDVGCALFFVASIYAFYRYVKKPGWVRLLLAGVAAGLLLATKHSGILVGPILPLMATWEVVIAPKGTRTRLALRLFGACTGIACVSVLVLWSFYGFRYSARPAGLQLVPTLSQYAGGLKPFERSAILTIARLHLLPESFLFGLVDIRVFAKNFNTFVLGRWYPHGVLWYFPIVIAIKSTLGLLAALALTAFAIVTGKFNAKFKSGSDVELDRGRALIYLLIGSGLFLAVAIQNGLNIGVRHILPVYAVAVILAGAGVAALAERSRSWMWTCAVLVAAHILSSLSVYPNTIAYANEAWGGPRNVHLYLSDSNVDWGQQLYQVKEWQDRHPGEECWFASFARSVAPPAEMYGITCHKLPDGMSSHVPPDSLESVPPIVHGAVLLSASEAAGQVWASKDLNPYRRFQKMKPDEEIDDGVLVYRGDFPMGEAGAATLAFQAMGKLRKKHVEEALALAEDAVKLAPDYLNAQWVLGDAAAAAGKKDEAREGYRKALTLAAGIEQERAAEYTKRIQDSLNKL
jgi:4-amino-4-deoxy-L-arabinose transferase-like glycosyltransferase